MTGTRETGNIGADERAGASRKPAGRTRLLMVLGFVAVAGGVSGCFFDNDSGPSRPPVNCEARRVVMFEWEVVKDFNSAPLNCDQAGASSMVLNVGTMQQDFPCPAGFQRGFEQSFPLASGIYQVSLQLYGGPGGAQVLSDTGVMTFSVPACDPLNLGLITFGTP